MSSEPPTRTRLSAAERRRQILAQAVPLFAVGGLAGTSTALIASRAGVAQPYLFRLFETKKKLFLACYEQACDQVLATFRDAAAGAGGGEVLLAMGLAYVELLRDRDALLLQMQAYVACADPEVREVVRRRYLELYADVEALSRAPADEVRAFFATGMLLNVGALIDLPELALPKED